jgi:hypothetical protein
VGLAGLALLLAGAVAAPTQAHAQPRAKRQVAVGEFTLPAPAMETLRQRWLDQIEAKYAPHTWAPLRMELSNDDLALMGLPSREALLAQRAAAKPMAAQGTAAFAGAGFFGIRPGAWLLLLNGGSVGWCSMAHVFGAPGSYKVSTAGHCGKVGDIATVIGVVGNRNPVLIDFGKFTKSVDGGLGNDYAFITVAPEYQHLVTPTMAFWGGPRGVYTSKGDLAALNYPNVSVTPNPALAQQIVHYGHGTGVGAGGTPRSATAISWRATQFMFFGAISPGDSGSGSNTLTGDVPGNTMEAAGINTHLYVDPLMRQGLGIMGGTRTSAIGTPANGQLLPYPVPAPGLP